MRLQAPLLQWVAVVARGFVTHLEGFFCKMRHTDGRGTEIRLPMLEVKDFTV
jgi:hypothetical protein